MVFDISRPNTGQGPEYNGRTSIPSIVTESLEMLTGQLTVIGFVMRIDHIINAEI